MWRRNESAAASSAAATATSSGSSAFSAAAARPTGAPPSTSTETTCPSAWTPVSVRPATASEDHSGKTLPSASRSVPSTVRRPGCAAQPRKPVPSYSSVSLSRTARIFLYGVAALTVAAAFLTLQQSVAKSSVGCTRVVKPAPKRNGGRKPPRTRLDPRRIYDVTLVTNCGQFAIRLDVRHSPHTSASFFQLARTHFFDKTVFHRIVPGFVIQGGDPTGTGTGGPGYTTVDRPPASARYSLGVVAMAKTQAQA